MVCAALVPATGLHQTFGKSYLCLRYRIANGKLRKRSHKHVKVGNDLLAIHAARQSRGRVYFLPGKQRKPIKDFDGFRALALRITPCRETPR
jgi:hypothetical protein